MSVASQVHDAIEQVCPIDGVSIGNRYDKSTWRIDFSKSATDEQKKLAVQALSDIDINVVTAVEVMTPEKKLAKLGLTVEDLKEILSK